MKNTPTDNTRPAISPYRWVVLVVFMLPVMTTQIEWLSFAPVASEAARLYGVDIKMIDLLSVVFMIVYIPVSFPASWCIDKWGLKFGTGIGVVLIGIAGFARIFAQDFSTLMVFQILCAAGQPFILNSFTKLAGNWFGEEEESLATGLATMSTFLGLLIIMFASDFIMQHFRQTGDIPGGMRFILTAGGVFALVSSILYLIFIKDRPATPPNRIAAEKKFAMLEGLRSLIKNRDFLLLFGAFFIGLGAFNTVSTKIEEIFKRPIGQNPLAASEVPGVMGGLIILGGICGAVILSYLSDRFRKRKIFLMLSVGLALPLVVLLAYLPYFYPLLFVSFAFGFFLVSAMPVGLTYAVEKTHPVPEATSNGILLMSGQVSGIALILLDVNMMVIAVLFGLGFLLTFFMRDIEAKLPRKD